MVRTLMLDVEDRDDGDGTLFELIARLEQNGTPPQVSRTTFRHEARVASPAVLDGYVLAVLLYALARADRIVVNGPVSAAAVRHVRILGEAWHAWFPERYRPIEIAPASIVSEAEILGSRAKTRNARAIAAFSGGVDSVFMALRQTSGELGNAAYPLSDVLLVHGFDVDVANQSDFDELVARVAPLLEELGLHLQIVRTDIRERIEQHWEHAHGAMLAAVLHQFSDRFEYGLIANTDPLTRPVAAWGSTYALDHLLSGDRFEIVHTDAAYARTEKVEVIARHPVATRALKVCWEGAHQGRNCGVCEKCVRTRLEFMAVGQAAPECFETPFDPASIASLSVATEGKLAHLRAVQAMARRREIVEDWVRLLDDRITELSEEIADERSIVRDRDLAIAERDAALASRDDAVRERDAAISTREAVLTSRIWRWSGGYRRLADWLRRHLPVRQPPSQDSDA